MDLTNEDNFHELKNISPIYNYKHEANFKKAKLENGTGNKTTAERITKYITGTAQNTLLCDVADFETSQEFADYVRIHHVTAIVAIHAYRSGKLLKDVGIPFALIFGGTDVQCSSWKEDQKLIMTDIVDRAKVLIAFSEVMRDRALKKWPFIKEENLIVQPQGVTTDASLPYTFQDLFKETNMPKHSVCKDPKVFIFIGGIRLVKDPLLLMDTVALLNKEDNSICMVIIGPELDKEYADTCKQKAASLDGVFMFQELSRNKVHALLHHSVALVNSSINEGMAGAILEAMDVGTPVIARRNTGNMSIIQDGSTGLLFDGTKDFIMKAKMLIEDHGLRQHLVDNAKQYVSKHHNAENEQNTYQQVVCTLMQE